MQCDTCHRDVPLVQRVVVEQDYNRMLAKPLYNCPACFEAKQQDRRTQTRTRTASR